jgi:GNAT superfamily N-acetyltransferase
MSTRTTNSHPPVGRASAPRQPLLPARALRAAMLAAGFSGGDRGVFLRYVEGRHAGEVHLRPRGRGIEIDTILTVSRFRGRGVSSAMLRDVCRVADGLGVPLALTACPVGETGLGLRELAGWYRRRGFEALPDQGPRSGLRMLREARRPEPETDRLDAASPQLSV